MADSSQPGISLTVRPGSHAIFNPNGLWCAFPAPGDSLSIRKADGPLPVGGPATGRGFRVLPGGVSACRQTTEV